MEKRRKAVDVILSSLLLFLGIFAIVTEFILPSHYYTAAKEALAAGDHTAAYSYFYKCSTYKDSAQYLRDFKVVATEVTRIHTDRKNPENNKETHETRTYDQYGDEVSSNTKNTYDEKGNLIVIEHLRDNGEVHQRVCYEYDEAGNRISVASYWGEQLSDKRNYMVCADGKLRPTISYDYDSLSKTYTKTEYIRDQQEKTLSIVTTDDAGKIRQRRDYEYDAKGNCLWERETGADGNVTSSNYSEYDRAGNCIRKTFYSEDAVSAVHTFRYDGNGNCRFQTSASAKGEILKTTESTYYADGTIKRRVEHDRSDDVERQSQWLCTWYHRNGYIKKRITVVKGIGGIRIIVEKMDGMGNELYHSYYQDGRLLSRTIRTYSPEGFLLSWKGLSFDEAGKVDTKDETVFGSYAVYN